MHILETFSKAWEMVFSRVDISTAKKKGNSYSPDADSVYILVGKIIKINNSILFQSISNIYVKTQHMVGIRVELNKG